MEELKNFDEIHSPDSRHASVGRELQALYDDVLTLTLPESVPESLRSAFAVACNLWLYGWFHWPFHTLAASEGYRLMEAALKDRCERDGVFEETGKQRHRSGLEWLFDQALKRSWIVDEGFENYHRYKARADGMLIPPGTIVEQSQRAPIDFDDPQSYSRILVKCFQVARNRRSHPRGHFHSTANVGLFEMEFARDVLKQLFPPL